MKRNMNLINTILYSLLSFQEKFLRFRLSGTIGVKNTSKSKRHFGNGCILDLNTLDEAERNRLEEELKRILKSCEYEPEKILEYVKKQGTEVYRINNANKFLNPVGLNEGFIIPQKGLKALYIALSVNIGFKLETDDMFIISEGEINKYYFIYHIYNWFAYKNGIAGLDSESQELLHKYLFSDSDTKNLQLSEIYKLKDAIKQDKVAIEFVVKLCREYEGTKNALEKLKSSDGARL